MTVQLAMDYIAMVRAAQTELRYQGMPLADCGLAGLLQHARDNGYEISERQLREAHRIDWIMRAHRFLPQDVAAAPASGE